MRIEQFEETIKKDDFAVGDSFWIDDWEFEVVNRRRGGEPVADEVVFKWELMRQEFIHGIAENHPEQADTEGFFDSHKEDLIHRFRSGFDALVGECGATYESVMNDAVEEALAQEQAKESSASCNGVTGKEDEKDTGTQEGKIKTVVTVAGERIVDIYESQNGRCWYVTKKIQKQGQGFVSGYVRCLWTPMLAEFQHLPEEVLQDTAQHMWRVPESAWGRCPCVKVERDGEGPTIVRWNGEDDGSRPPRSCPDNSQPATYNQKQLMMRLGITFSATVSRQEAAAMIDEELGKGKE